MDEQKESIIYKLVDGKQVNIEVSTEVKVILEQTDRKIRSQSRQDRRRLSFVGDVEELDVKHKPIQEDAADIAMRNDSVRQLFEAIEKLSKVRRRRLCLYYFCGLKYREIAGIENVNISAVSRSLQKAREELKDYLSD